MKNYQDKGMFLERRLLRMSPPEAVPTSEPTSPATVEEKKTLEAIEYKDKISVENIDKIADRVRNLDVAETDILKENDRGPATVAKFRVALRNVLEGQKTQINVKNLDLFLLNGLLENLSKADKKVTEVDKSEAEALNKFFKDNKVAKFSIESGYWKFFDKDGNAVKADYVLDGVEGKGEKTVLGSEVKEAQKREEDANKKRENEAKAEADRVKPENLEKVSSAYSTMLKKGQKMDEVVAALAVSLLTDKQSEQVAKDTNAPVTYPIKNDEIKAALTAYVEGYSQGDAEKNFAAFLEQVMASGFKECRIVKGRIAFSKDGRKFSSNPTGMELGGQEVVLYAHPELGRVRAEEAQKKAAEKVEGGKPLDTPYDAAEARAVQIITGKEQPDERDVNNANIDARYLPAIKSILAYPLNGKPVDVKTPFNDFNPLNCKFYAAKDGSYVLSWDNGKGFSRYMPTVRGEPGLKEARKYFVANLNNGWIFKEVQRMNILDKSRLAHWGQEIDDGPKEMPDGGIYYEFDWKGRDPDVTIYAERHGVLRVVVEKSGIALDGGKRYEFRAAGFQDMMRTFKRLQRWVESDNINKGKLRQGEEDARFFEQVVDGARDYRAEAARRGAGKLLSVTSVNNMNPDGTFDKGAFDRGYYLEFDWMQKMVPAQRMQIFRNGVGNFEFYLMPRRQKLGEMGPQVTAREAMTNALVLAAEQRQLLTTKGGEVLRQRAFTDVLEAINKSEVRVRAEVEPAGRVGPVTEKVSEKPFVLMSGVTVAAASAASGDFYLSRDEGMSPVRFHFGTADRPNFAQFQRAERQGYLVRVPKDSTETNTTSEINTTLENQPPAPKDKVEVVLDSPRALKERTTYSDERRDAVNQVCDRLKRTVNYDRVVRYAAFRLAAFEPHLSSSQPAQLNTELIKNQFVNELWRILAELSEVKGAYITEKNVQNTIINKLKGNNKLNELDIKSRMPDQESLKNLPLIRMYLLGMFDSFEKDILNGNDREGYTDAFKAGVLKAYRESVLEKVNKIINDNKQNVGELPVKYEKRIYNIAFLTIKLPREFLKEYIENEEVRKKYEEWKARNKEQAERGNLLTDKHLFKLEEVENKQVGGMVAVALRLFKSVKSLEQTDIFFSRIEGNTLLAQDNAYFNVKAGKVPGTVLPMTLRFFRENGGLRVSAVDGWNNNSEAPRRDWVGASGEAGEKAVDLAIARAMANHEGLNADTMRLPPAAPTAAPTTAPTAASPAKPAAPPAAK